MAADAALTNIYAPTKVGIPPENAFCGLVQLPDGELRHYGYRGAQGKPSEHIYITSTDGGLTWDNGTVITGQATTGESGPPAACVPWSGSFVRVVSKRGEGTTGLRSTDGIDGDYEEVKIDDGRFGMIRQPIFMRSRNRMLVTGGTHTGVDGRSNFISVVFYSDDDGRTWGKGVVPSGPHHAAVWPHEKPRWGNNGVEPTLTELGNGRLWMLLRTSTDVLYESFSDDGGATWSEQTPSRFYSTITMPTLFRLKDGRLLLFWCNTTPLPEVSRSNDMTIRAEQKTGLWEDVFTNRDAIHAAISEDDGKTWIGFRELYLNPLRNEPDFATSGGNESSLDKSVHQSQAVELPHGRILVALGQHPSVRSMVIFDPAWLYETKRADDFSNGLDEWSTFTYIDGIKGHCAYDRKPGAPLIDHPDITGGKVLHISRPSDPDLVCENEGAVWNFHAGLKGSFTARIRLNPGGAGGRVSLIDRWFNPTDVLAARDAMYTFTFRGDGSTMGPVLRPGEWHEFRFEWDDCRSEGCRLVVDGEPRDKPLALNRPSVNGICYVHFQSIAHREDTHGFLVASVSAEVKR